MIVIKGQYYDPSWDAVIKSPVALDVGAEIDQGGSYSYVVKSVHAHKDGYYLAVLQIAKMFAADINGRRM